MSRAQEKVLFLPELLIRISSYLQPQELGYLAQLTKSTHRILTNERSFYLEGPWRQWLRNGTIKDSSQVEYAWWICDIPGEMIMESEPEEALVLYKNFVQEETDIALQMLE